MQSNTDPIKPLSEKPTEESQKTEKKTEDSSPPKAKKHLGFFDKLKGFKTVEEKEKFREVKTLIDGNKLEDANSVLKAYLQKNPSSTVKKLEKVLHKKQAQSSQNVFTQLFDKEDNKKDESIVDQIVKRKAEKEEKQKQAVLGEKQHSQHRREEDEKEKIQDEKMRKEKKSHTQFYLSVFVILIVGIAYSFFIIQLDEENSVLSIAGIENTGIHRKELKEEEKDIKKTITELEKEIKDIENNVAITKETKDLYSIMNKRIAWTELLKEVQIVTSQVPQSYLDDLLFWTYSGTVKDYTLSIGGEAKNEKVFTLVANLIDKINEYEIFKNLEYRSYSKSKGDEESSEFKTGLNLKFNFIPEFQKNIKKVKTPQKIEKIDITKE